jgi:transketolase
MPARRHLANAIRALSMDAVQQANSGHPGAPMGLADSMEVLWRDVLRHNPGNPQWPDRDRFVLSNGHASMLLYSVLHLTGYPLPMQALRDFRQLHSATPGHPEYGETPGVETTTGPLGQGLANAVGMAIAEQALAARYNRSGFAVVDHHTWCVAGDGCLMEGISHEACSLAGTLALGKLVVLYDDNGISIDGPVSGWFSEDVPARFRSYGWQVVEAVDGHDPDAVAAAIATARADTRRPSLICLRTVIGYGAPGAAGTSAVHGAPLGAAGVAAARAELGWPYAPFEIPDEVRAAWDGRARGARLEADWAALFERYRQAYPVEAAELLRCLSGDLPEGFVARADALIAELNAGGKSVATRKASELALEGLAPLLPELLGGSADLTGSNNTRWSGCTTLEATNPGGNYLHYGVREFAMTAIQNGLALHGGVIPYAGTFLVFSDYARNAVRMAALMRLRSVLVYTHDSIGLGEDGPTHQPIEHLAALRLIPNLSLWRPCDAAETAAAWRAALLRRDGPTALVLSRQALPAQTREPGSLADLSRGGYVLREFGAQPQALLMATGSEVALAVAAAERLWAAAIPVRVVSMPSLDVFEAQSADWREQVLPAGVALRVAMEAGRPDSWYRYVGSAGAVIGIDRFGASAPAELLFDAFGFTVERVVAQVMDLLDGAT